MSVELLSSRSAMPHGNWPMPVIEVRFKLEKEKGALRYQEVDEKGEVIEQAWAKIGTLYIRKSGFERAAVFPERLRVTVETAGRWRRSWSSSRSRLFEARFGRNGHYLAGRLCGEPALPGHGLIRPFLHLNTPRRRLRTKKGLLALWRRQAARHDVPGMIDQRL